MRWASRIPGARIFWLMRAGIAVAAFLVLIALAAAAPPGHAVRIGVLSLVAPNFDPATNPFARELAEGLRELGYTLGRDVSFEFRSANGDVTALPKIAAELVDLKVDMLLTPMTNNTLAAAKATNSIPIVMVGATDPVDTGIVASLARPGGNVTGLAVNAAEIAAKRVQLLKEAVPNLSRVAVLWNASLRSMTLAFQNIEQASPRLGVTLQSVRVTGSDEFDRAFAAIESSRPDGLIVLFGPLRGTDLPRIVEFAASRQIPTIFEPGEGIRGGGLIEFGAKISPMFRRAAVYIDKIANGANPADLPVEEPTQFDLAINLKAAKSMGIEVPYSLLLRADRVVE